MKYSARHSQNLMKFVLVLYLCSFIQAGDNCYQDGYGPIEYPTYGECILDGYRVSYLTLKMNIQLKK